MEPSFYSLPDYDESGDLISAPSPIRKITSRLEDSFNVKGPSFTSDMESQCIHQSTPDNSHIIRLHKTGSFEVERVKVDKGVTQSPDSPSLHGGRGTQFVPYGRTPSKTTVKVSPEAGSLFEVHNLKSEQALSRVRGLIGRTRETRSSIFPAGKRESETFGPSGDSHHPVVYGHTFSSTYPTHATDVTTASNFQELLCALESACSLLGPMNMMADGVCENVAHIRKRLHRVWLEYQQKKSSKGAVLSISSTEESSNPAYIAASQVGALAFHMTDICLSALEKYSREDELQRREYKERIQALHESGAAAVRKAVRSEREAAGRRKNDAIQLERSNTANQVAAFERGGNAIGNIEKQLRMRCEYLEEAMEGARRDLKAAIENGNTSNKRA